MSKLAVHYIPTHGRQADLDFIHARSPYCIKLVYSSKPDVGHLNQMLGLLDLARATVVLRDHALSEQKDDVRRDPVGTGTRHAQEWDATLDRLLAETPLGQAWQVLVEGINECPVWEAIQPWVDYYAVLMDKLVWANVLALNLPVGWPANSGGDSPSNWQPYRPVLERCGAGGHWLGLHEYFSMQHGPSFYAGWWAYRYRHLIEVDPDVPILIGECAPTGSYQNADGSWGLEAQNGWMGNLSPEAMWAQLVEYDNGLSRDPQVTYATVFTTDAAQPWIGEYDTSGMASLWTAAQSVWTGVDMPEIKPPEPPNPSPGAVYWPVPGGYITGRFGETYVGEETPHPGLDIGASEGTPVIASLSGEVMWVDYEENGYGFYCRIFNAANRLHFFYAHLRESAYVVVGQQVEAGEQIGVVGSTGNSSGPHCHFEVRCGDRDGYIDLTFGYSRGRCCPEVALWTLGLRGEAPGPLVTKEAG